MFSKSFNPLLDARIRFFECEVFFFGTAHKKAPSHSGSWIVVALKMLSLRLFTSESRPKRAVDADCVIDVLSRAADIVFKVFNQRARPAW